MDVAFQLREVRAETEGGFVAPCYHQSRGPLLAGCRHRRRHPTVVIVLVVAFAAVDAMGVDSVAVVGSPDWE
jgi:hypothetical protein